MKLLHDVAAAKAYLRPRQQQGLRIGFVPTMGALHDGHLSLVQVARQRTDVVVASVFVNPTQFGLQEDLARYPRDLEGDANKLAGAGCDVLFAPSVAVMYPPGFQTTVHLSETTQGLCGAARPGHFDGVTTVVLKLFGIVRPDVAVFGEKDFQQLATLKAMARDLDLDVEIVGAPILREPDGLAMSSRNVYLSDEDRVRARSLSRGLFAARRLHEGGERDGARLLDAVRNELTAAGVEPEYLALRGADDLRPISNDSVSNDRVSNDRSASDQVEGATVILVAARVGQTRLIDNVILNA